MCEAPSAGDLTESSGTVHFAFLPLMIWAWQSKLSGRKVDHK